jgi:type IV pilus assembly protein PilB
MSETESPRAPRLRKLGELLVEAGLVAPAQVDRALRESRQTGEPLGKILLKRGLVTEEQLGKALSAQAGTDYLRIGSWHFDRELLDLFPQDFMQRNQVLPMQIRNGALQVVMVHPNDVDTLDEIRLLTGLKPQAVVTTAKEFDDAFSALLSSLHGHVTEAIASLRQEASETPASDSQRLADEVAVEDQPIVRLLNSILADAITRGASDVHLEPREKHMRIRLRIDGVMIDVTEVPKDLEAAMISRLKIMASMDIAERRRPQDGRGRLVVTGKSYDLRIGLIPSIWGEKAVIRILRPAMLFGGIESLGLLPETFERFKNLIAAPHGIVLTTGPTGSGKTTSLYSALYELNTPDRNIVTVEDPVEYPLEGVTQTQVNSKSGLSFADALRALLRQDPDIIMVGEIRDQETLQAAVFAALTGHLVLSTIHTNDAASTPTRLHEMGLPAYLMTSAIRGIVAQRLVRRLCPHCREPFAPGDAYPEALRQAPLYRAKGCGRCRQTGFGGRVGLFEIMPMTPAIQELIGQAAPSYRIREAAAREGMLAMADDALRKVHDGVTTPEEVARALGPNWTEQRCQASSTTP